MSRRMLLAFCVVLGGGQAVRAQEPAYREELRFIDKMRTEGYSDLALDYLKRLQKNPTPELARELPLELAKTQMMKAADEPDSLKRLALYDQAKQEFEKFLAANPGHPRAREANLDIGRVLALRGKTQLSRALMQGSVSAREAEGLKARNYLAEAGKKLKEAVASAKDDNEKVQAEMEVALNLVDQAMTYDRFSTDEKVLLPRAAKMQEAVKMLKPLAGGEPKDPLTWKARAWLGRSSYELGDPKEARRQLNTFRGLTRDLRAASEGERLARYFMMLVIQEKADPDDKPLGTLIQQGERWLKSYGRFLNTPEGYGVRYLLAEEYVKQAANPASKGVAKANLLARARTLLRGVEQTENDYTDRARVEKFKVVKLQGGFDKSIKELKTFEDSYIRAQYEIWQMGEEGKKIKEEAEREKKRKQRVANVLLALEQGLEKKDAKPLTAKGKPNIEYNNAQAMLAFYTMNAGAEAWNEYKAILEKFNAAEGAEKKKLEGEVTAKRKEALDSYDKAIRVGEGFARGNPRSGQATTAALYALQAYSQVIAGREAAGAAADDLKELKDKMTALANYMEQRWPKELAGDMARHQLALRYYRDKNWPEAIKKLASINPTYPSYAFSQYQLADALFKEHDALAEQGKAPEAAARRKEALATLAKVQPPPASADPSVNRIYVTGKARLIRELYKDKQYGLMATLAKDLQPKLAGLKFDYKAEADAALRKQFETEVAAFQLYSLYGQSEALFQAKKYAAVVKVLDPVVEAINKGGMADLKANKALSVALVSMDLKSNVQLGKQPPTEAALNALQALTAGDGGGEGTTRILAQLVGIIEQQLTELRKKNDKEGLASAIKNFTRILNTVVKRKDTKPTPEVQYLLGKAYANMDRHAEAAKVLESMPKPKAGDAKRERLYKATRLMVVAELRKTGDPAQIKKAQALLDEIIGTKEKRGWGYGSLPALKEQGLLYECDKMTYGKGAKLFNSLVGKLLKKIDDSALREEYLDCYYHMVYCILKYAQNLDDMTKRAKYVRDAALQASQLAKNIRKKYGEFGSEASKRRFMELLEKEPEFKAVFEELKGK